jgi:hypothetical protein
VQSLLEHTARYIQEFDRPPRLLSFTGLRGRERGREREREKGRGGRIVREREREGVRQGQNKRGRLRGGEGRRERARERAREFAGISLHIRHTLTVLAFILFFTTTFYYDLLPLLKYSQGSFTTTDGLFE